MCVRPFPIPLQAVAFRRFSLTRYFAYLNKEWEKWAEVKSGSGVRVREWREWWVWWVNAKMRIYFWARRGWGLSGDVKVIKETCSLTNFHIYGQGRWAGEQKPLTLWNILTICFKESNFQSPNFGKCYDPTRDSNVQQQGKPSHHRCSGLYRPWHRKEILPHSGVLVNRRKCVQHGRRTQTAQPLL